MVYGMHVTATRPQLPDTSLRFISHLASSTATSALAAATAAAAFSSRTGWAIIIAGIDNLPALLVLAVAVIQLDAVSR